MEIPVGSETKAVQSGTPMLTITCSVCGQVQKTITMKKSEVQNFGEVTKMESDEVTVTKCGCP